MDVIPLEPTAYSSEAFDRAWLYWCIRHVFYKDLLKHILGGRVVSYRFDWNLRSKKIGYTCWRIILIDYRRPHFTLKGCKKELEGLFCLRCTFYGRHKNECIGYYYLVRRRFAILILHSLICFWSSSIFFCS